MKVAAVVGRRLYGSSRIGNDSIGAGGFISKVSSY